MHMLLFYARHTCVLFSQRACVRIRVLFTRERCMTSVRVGNVCDCVPNLCVWNACVLTSCYVMRGAAEVYCLSNT